MNRGLAVGALGVSLLLATLAGVTLPISGFVGALGNDYLLVASLAGVAALVATPVLASGRSQNLEQADVPAPEAPTTAPTAGVSFDDLLADRTLALPIIGRSRRRAVEERLRAAAVDVVMHRESCPRETARERVERGEWTTDPAAAAFLGPGASVRSVLRSRHHARLTAEAIVEYAAGTHEGRR